MSAKYPRSFHLPWSPGGTRDDKRLESVEPVIGVPIVITEKLDGSNLTYTRDHVFARSHSGPPTHASFAYAKATHARIRHRLEPGISVFCEYCYAVHSIEYDALPDYSFVFGVRDDERDEWWSWEMVEAQAADLELPTVPVLFRGVVPTLTELQSLTTRLAAYPSIYGHDREGVVVRVENSFPSDSFSRLLGKYVRAGHVTTSEHWMFEAIRPQPLDPQRANGPARSDTVST